MCCAALKTNIKFLISSPDTIQTQWSFHLILFKILFRHKKGKVFIWSPLFRFVQDNTNCSIPKSPEKLWKEFVHWDFPSVRGAGHAQRSEAWGEALRKVGLEKQKRISPKMVSFLSVNCSEIGILGWGPVCGGPAPLYQRG